MADINCGRKNPGYKEFKDIRDKEQTTKLWYRYSTPQRVKERNKWNTGVLGLASQFVETSLGTWCGFRVDLVRCITHWKPEPPTSDNSDSADITA